MSENKLTLSIHSPIPPSEEVAEALGRGLMDLARECEQAGWQVTIVMTMTKDGAGPGASDPQDD